MSVWAGIAALAAVGGVIAFFYSDRGRETIRRFESGLDEFGHAVQQLRGTLRKAGRMAAEGMDVAAEGMDVVAEIISTVSDRGGRRGRGALQASREG